MATNDYRQDMTSQEHDQTISQARRYGLQASLGVEAPVGKLPETKMPQRAWKPNAGSGARPDYGTPSLDQGSMGRGFGRRGQSSAAPPSNSRSMGRSRNSEFTSHSGNTIYNVNFGDDVVGSGDIFGSNIGVGGETSVNSGNLTNIQKGFNSQQSINQGIPSAPITSSAPTRTQRRGNAPMNNWAPPSVGEGTPPPPPPPASTRPFGNDWGAPSVPQQGTEQQTPSGPTTVQQAAQSVANKRSTGGGRRATTKPAPTPAQSQETPAAPQEQPQETQPAAPKRSTGGGKKATTKTATTQEPAKEETQSEAPKPKANPRSSSRTSTSKAEASKPAAEEASNKTEESSPKAPKVSGKKRVAIDGVPTMVGTLGGKPVKKDSTTGEWVPR